MENIDIQVVDRHIPTSPYLHIHSLSLHHFRNYETIRLETDGRLIVLTGRNGAGKTNILEALSLLTPGRGLRKAKLSEMDSVFLPPLRGEVRRGGATFSAEHEIPHPLAPSLKGRGNPWTISAHIHGMQGPAQIGTGRVEEEGADKRLVKIDGKPCPHTHLGKHLTMLWLTPQMEQLFLEGASAGRKFLDRMVYSFDSEHATRINAYEFAMRERNKLLETGGGDRAWLDSLEEKMAEGAVAIARARLTAIHGINDTIVASSLSFPKARLNADGFVETRLQSGVAEPEVQKSFHRTLAENRMKDAAAGRALIGAHRSELKVLHVEKHMPAESCSTGEQKALLLSIVLSQARFSMAKKGMPPVLLFDEILSHLDAIRRLELFEEICQIGAQTWMTGTDANLFADLREKADFFQVDNGQII